MSNDNLIRCSHISVDCVANDPVDIRCGGPKYLGFDFYVREEQTQEMQEFVAATLESFEVPSINLYISGTNYLSKKDVWTKESIVNEIRENAEYLQEEAERNYGSTSFTRNL